ncbi:hypothetical protein GCM10022419_009300 [Nonomuraea rosea]|uniref:Uncharacterized protein n=1 Tax=Nonomuraea rosea TaxID=638574 RepID=A0ABP6VF43_9ACTN
MRSRSSARARSAYSAPSLLMGGPRLITLPVKRAPVAPGSNRHNGGIDRLVPKGRGDP